MPPITTTKITSLHVTASASTFITLVGTGKPTSSRRADGVQTSSGTTTATEEKGGCQGSKPTAIAANATTVFIVTQLPTPTDTIRPQPTSKASSAPAPEKTSSPASPQPTPHFSSRVCLGDDGSTYTDPGTGDTFKIECTASHQGKDIVNLEAQTMEECVSLCAKNTHCKGAAWYNVGPQGTDLNYCWLKSEMADDVRITADAQSVVRL
ncbi:hypothetical protein F5B18DRAFT_439531 [Nemania serpens]|nr:hypothetical protein F5B18DRAFT_439531 [Nemania serpens]